MKRYIKWTYTITVIAAILLVLTISFALFSQTMLRTIQQTLRSNLLTAQISGMTADTDYTAFEQAMITDYLHPLRMIRITVIAPDGTILYENKADSSEMGSHANREEILEAIQSGYGEATRKSETMGIKTLYVAMPMKDRTIVRLAVSLNVLQTMFIRMLPLFLSMGILLLVVITLFAEIFSRKLMRPFDNLEFSLTHLYETGFLLEQENVEFEEWIPVLRSIRNIAKKLHENTAELRSRKAEVDTILRSAEDGIILLSKKNEVISVNNTAKTILQKDTSNFMYRYPEFQTAIEKAVCTGIKTSFDLDLSPTKEKVYRCFVNPAVEEDEFLGAILFLSDVTEILKLERMRTDFISNVSHELKSPLTSIRGFSELIAAGFVPEEARQKDYLQRIIKESDRLLHLINDILYLSETEKGTSQKENFEEIDLYTLACDVKDILETQAKDKGITIAVDRRENATIVCEYEALREILLNLIDNGIKYNRVGGHVWVCIDKNKDGRTTISVKDDGIGIEDEHKERIFERFYRVDKARSRKAGSTGLGLSIVKRTAQKYGIKIEMDSVAGVGTEIRLIL